MNNRPTLHKVAQVLASFADHDTGARARPSLQTIAEAVQVCQRTVQRALDTLQALGVVRMVRSHSWRLHRPTEWAISADVLRECRRKALQAVRERSGRYWASLRAWAVEHYRKAPNGSGRQVCRLPSPLQGERGGAERRDREVTVSPPFRNSLLDILSNLRAAHG